MGDRDNEHDHEHKLDTSEREPEAGEGARSLTNWQNLARARQSIAANEDSRHEFQADPVAYMRRFGIDGGNLGQVDRASFAVGISTAQELSAHPDTQLAFCKVWGVTIVVAAAAAAAAVAVVAAANAAAAANAVAAANVWLIANVTGD